MEEVILERPTRGGRIALPGGPGGGKTTAEDRFRREIGERASRLTVIERLVSGLENDERGSSS